MKLSTKGEYGVRALVHLACNYNEGPISLREISKIEDISYQYLEQIFLDLRRNSLVLSVRGAKGGYTLASHPKEITVGDVIRAVEGPIAPVSCVAKSTNSENTECDRSSTCAPRGVWLELRDRISEVLDEFTLQDLAVTDNDIEKLRGEHNE
ncbi:RrF2 family transcriptional regulator [Natranaerobius thermophilus]|uniref:RrF2 family transcriptional regulator n=1 Tax=Natranaerobius thermophilus TaxID=375929 RepID=UPI00016695A2|nr:Rrf2 family transcriptional regulator [Natranaerobius thermophilus]